MSAEPVCSSRRARQLTLLDEPNVSSLAPPSPLSGCPPVQDTILIQGLLYICQFGSPTNVAKQDSFIERYVQLRGDRLLIGDSDDATMESLCVLNSGYLIRGQTGGIISIFNPGKAKISLKAPNEEMCQRWVTCLRKASIGYRGDSTAQTFHQGKAVQANADDVAKLGDYYEDLVEEDSADEEDECDEENDERGDHVAYPFDAVPWVGEWTGVPVVDGRRKGHGTYRIGQLIFAGEWSNDMLNGFGTMVDVETRVKYSGEWRHNCQHGRGELDFGNGDRYVGDFFNGRIMGSGVITQGSSRTTGHTAPQPQNQYRGQFCDGTIMGFGSMFWSRGDHYEGTFKNGVAHGHGKLTYSELGQIHIGQWTDGIISGTCEIHFVMSGVRFVGDFGDMSGAGRSGQLYYKDGGQYDGQIQGEYRHGQGTMTWANGSVYRGGWVTDEMSGDGIMTSSPGDAVYSGQFVQSRKSGFGEMNVAGRKYTGNWMDDQPFGNGVMVFANGNIYDGVWERGHRTGPGKLVFNKTKAVVEGDFLDGKLHGQGTIILVDGSSFKGSFHNYIRVGVGTTTLPNGETFAAEYRDDRPVKGDIGKTKRGVEWTKAADRELPFNEASKLVAPLIDDQSGDKHERFSFMCGAKSNTTVVDCFSILDVDEIDCPFIAY